MWLGLLAVIIAPILFGSFYVPVKHFAPTDGFFVQWVMVIGAGIESAIFHVIQGCPPMYPLVMLGGAWWCIANAFAPILINQLGMALGILIWDITQCLGGWATSRFGWFGLPEAVPTSPTLNYIGVALVIIGGIMYMFIMRTEQPPICGGDSSEDLNNMVLPKLNTSSVHPEEKLEEDSFKEKKTGGAAAALKHAVAVLCALISGVAYGTMLVPIVYIREHHVELNAPESALAYHFSFFCGAVIASTVIFAFYAIIKKNRPHIVSRLVLPSLSSGLILSTAIAIFLFANEDLSPTIAYPIGIMLPGLVVSLWSTLYFKEITGKRNLLLLATGYCITLTGVTLVALSRIISF